MRTIDHLIEASQVARRASTTHRDIEIVLSEVGLVIRGKTRVGARAVAHSDELRWSEFDHSPHLLANGVRLIADRLAAAERSGP
jgi:hypothetical protein